MAEPVPENKTQRVERLKREKNAWEHLDEIRAFARDGFASIPPEWLGTYFRAWGVYTQGDGAGVTGGNGGEGKAVPYFMVRVRIPGGLLNSAQLRLLSRLAERHARGVLDITVRQNVQLHWVTIESLPELLRELWSAGLTTLGSCGDVARNITGCPVAGLAADELLDASPLILQLNRFFVNNADFYNLPRKFKVSVTGCASWCSYPEINDVGLTAVRRKRVGREETGFSLRVGGGLSTQPHLAERLNAFVTPAQVLPVVQAVAGLFRDADVLRQSREQARLKFLFLKFGWNAETFLEELHLRLGYKLDAAEEESVPSGVYRDHVGVHAQKQEGLFYVGASVLRGRLTAAQVAAVAELAERFGNGEVRATTQQNLILANVTRENTAAVAGELAALGLPVEASPFWRGTVACTGTEFCKLAITETKGFARWVVEELEGQVPGFDQQLRLNITGCPNSCGQHWIADLGLEGKKIKVDGRLTDAYYFCIGGAVGKVAAVARPVGYRCLATDVPHSIARLLARYTGERAAQESFQQYLSRKSDEEIRNVLAGAAVQDVARDLPSAPAPHNVEG